MKLADDPYAKFIFYNITGHKKEEGCVNLLYNLLHQHLNSYYYSVRGNVFCVAFVGAD